MLQRLIEKLRPWGEALAGLDDPRGEYLLGVENRIRRLEGEVKSLRDAAAAANAAEA
jgi:hypothetical protein